MNITCVALIFTTLFSGLLAAGDGAGRTCRILFVNQGNNSPKSIQLFDGEKSLEVELPSMNLSMIYPIPDETRKLSLTTTPVSDPAELAQDSPSVTIPAEVKHCYLLVFDDPDNKTLPLRLRLVNAGDERIGRGEMLWINLTDSTIQGSLGLQKLNVEANTEVVVGEPHKGPGSYAADLNYLKAAGQNPLPLIQGQWRHSPQSRSLVLVTNGGEHQPPRILSFSDYRNSEAPKE